MPEAMVTLLFASLQAALGIILLLVPFLPPIKKPESALQVVAFKTMAFMFGCFVLALTFGAVLTPPFYQQGNVNLCIYSRYSVPFMKCSWVNLQQFLLTLTALFAVWFALYSVQRKKRKT